MKTEESQPVSELDTIKARLADHKAVADMVRAVFYSSPIDGSSMNLAAALERHALGLPLISVDQGMRAFLDSLSPEDRASWWRAKNAETAGPAAP